MNQFIVIDIGGTAIKYGIANADGSLLKSEQTPTEAFKGGKALADKVRGLCEMLIKEAPDAKGIAISSAGVIDPEKASVLHASDAIPGYKGVSFRETLRSFNLPVEAENDVNCAGLAEALHGAGKGSRSMLMLTIGTGIGGCFVNESTLLGGSCCCACEVGYLPLEGGAFQDLASTTALVKDVAARKGEPFEEWNGRRIFEGAAAGDADCVDAINRLCSVLGKGIAALCFVLNPECVVLGGGIMAQEKALRPGIEASFAENSIPLIAENTTIAFAQNQNEAGMKGALVHFLSKHPQLNA